MPFLTNEEKGVFILCRTSNPSAKTFQSLNFHDEVKLYEQVAKWADSLNDNDNVGLVVGATAPEELIKVEDLLRVYLFLFLVLEPRRRPCVMHKRGK